MSVSDIPAITDQLSRFLALVKDWNADMSQIISETLNKGIGSLQDIDQLLMTSTKLVDVKLREALSLFTGSAIPQQSGLDLLDLCVSRGLIKSRNDALFLILKWYFLTPRNTSHHQFTEHPSETVIMFVLTTNYLLNEINKLAGQTAVSASYNANFNPAKVAIEISVNSLMRGQNPVDTGAKVEAIVRFNDKTIKTVPLTRASGTWTGAYDVRGEPGPTASILFRGQDLSGAFMVSSGTVVKFDFGTCKYCGTKLNGFSMMCPRCLKNQL